MHLESSSRSGYLAALSWLLFVWAGFAQTEPLDFWRWRNPSPQGNTLHRVAFLGGRFIATGDNGVVLSSTNGTNWQEWHSGTVDAINGVTWGNGRFVTAGELGTIFTSVDGLDWTQGSANVFEDLHSIVR